MKGDLVSKENELIPVVFFLALCRDCADSDPKSAKYTKTASHWKTMWGQACKIAIYSLEWSHGP
jgi:hypothetical protein